MPARARCPEDASSFRELVGNGDDGIDNIRNILVVHTWVHWNGEEAPSGIRGNRELLRRVPVSVGVERHLMQRYKVNAAGDVSCLQLVHEFNPIDAEVFTIYKFRTMQTDAPDIRNNDGSTFNSNDDPRVTKAGRILRKTSLDELPQLVNVMKGEMSLVGPRPDPPDAVVNYRPHDFLRLSMKPGMTGWAAIHGRNEIPWQTRRDLDLEYVRDWSFFLDLRILLMTIPYALTGRGVVGKAKSDSGDSRTREG